MVKKEDILGIFAVFALLILSSNAPELLFDLIWGLFQ